MDIVNGVKQVMRVALFKIVTWSCHRIRGFEDVPKLKLSAEDIEAIVLGPLNQDIKKSLVCIIAEQRPTE